MELPLYSVCAGRIILAHYSSAHLEQCLIRLGLPTREDWPEIYGSEHPERELVNALTRIRQCGYDWLEDCHGITGFAAPLFMGGHVKGSIGTYLPTERVKDKDKIVDALLHYAGEINQKLDVMNNYNSVKR